MTDPTPTSITNNGPFNRANIIKTENGTTVIMDSPIALLTLCFLAIVMLFQLIRMHKEALGLKKKCSCDCECCQGCKNKPKDEECNCVSCACEDA